MEQSIQKWTKENLWNTAFKKSEVIRSVKTDHINSNLSKTVSINFAWSVLQYFVSHV